VIHTSPPSLEEHHLSPGTHLTIAHGANPDPLGNGAWEPGPDRGVANLLPFEELGPDASDDDEDIENAPPAGHPFGGSNAGHADQIGLESTPPGTVAASPAQPIESRLGNTQMAMLILGFLDLSGWRRLSRTSKFFEQLASALRPAPTLSHQESAYVRGMTEIRLKSVRPLPEIAAPHSLKARFAALVRPASKAEAEQIKRDRKAVELWKSADFASRSFTSTESPLSLEVAKEALAHADAHQLLEQCEHWLRVLDANKQLPSDLSQLEALFKGAAKFCASREAIYRGNLSHMYGATLAAELARAAPGDPNDPNRLISVKVELQNIKQALMLHASNILADREFRRMTPYLKECGEWIKSCDAGRWDEIDVQEFGAAAERWKLGETVLKRFGQAAHAAERGDKKPLAALLAELHRTIHMRAVAENDLRQCDVWLDQSTQGGRWEQIGLAPIHRAQVFWGLKESSPQDKEGFTRTITELRAAIREKAYGTPSATGAR
jgi:hypothetical protein